MNLIIIFFATNVFPISIAIFVLYVGYLWRKNKEKCLSLARLSLISFPLTYLLAKIAGYIIHDPRPFVVEHIKPLIAHAADNGFPSDHTLLTSVIASVIYVYNKKLGMVLFVISIAIGSARVLAGIHHPLDIVGAMVISIVAVYASWTLIQRIKLLSKKKI